MTNTDTPRRSATSNGLTYEYASEAAIVCAPFLLCIGLIGSLPWIAG